MIQRLGLYLFLGVLTLGLGYSFFVENIAFATFSVFYPYNFNEQSLNQEALANSYCKETFRINRYNTKLEQQVFTVFENLVTGPTDVFLDPMVNVDLSIKRVYLYDDLLVVDFNRFLLELSPSEEVKLMQAFTRTMEYNFPNLKEFKWLVDGKKFMYINGSYRYQEIFTLNQIKSNLATNKHLIKPIGETLTKHSISPCSNVS